MLTNAKQREAAAPPYLLFQIQENISPTRSDLESHCLPLCSPMQSPLPPCTWVPFIPTVQSEALPTAALQNGDGSHIEELSWPEDCADFFLADVILSYVPRWTSG